MLQHRRQQQPTKQEIKTIPSGTPPHLTTTATITTTTTTAVLQLLLLIRLPHLI